MCLWNRASVVEWNLEKSYLRDLRARGVPIPDTVWVDRLADVDLSAVLADRNWSKAVVKPLLFARVDGVDVGGRLVLMELELIEPSLFLGADPSAPVRFAEAIVSMC